MAEGQIPLADTVEAVRREIAKAVDAAADADIRFPVGDITLEFQVGVTRTGEGSAGVNVWVLQLGGGGSHSRETVQTVTVALQPPVGRDGRPVKVTSRSRRKPG